MSKSFTLAFFLCYCWLAAAKIITIDTLISDDTPDTVSKLENAIPLIVDPATKQFFDENNTIIFLENTVGIDQLFTNFIVSGSRQGGLSLIFSKTVSRPTEKADCGLLPTILLSESLHSSFIAVTGLDYFYIQGIKLALHVDASNQVLNFISLNNLTMDLVCFEDLDTVERPRSSASTGPLYSRDITSLTMTNILFLYKIQPTIFIGSIGTANINAIKIIMQPSASTELASAIFNVSGAYDSEGVFTSTLTANDWSVTCGDPNTLRSAQVSFGLQIFDTVNISNLRLTNCFLGSAYDPSFFFIGVYNLFLDDVEVADVKVDVASNDLTLQGYTVMGFYYCNVSLSNALFSNLQVKAATILGEQKFTALHFYEGYPRNLQITNVEFRDSVYDGKTNLILIYGYQNLSNPVINLFEGFRFSNLSINTGTCIRLLAKDEELNSNYEMTLNAYLDITFKDFTIENCVFNGSTIGTIVSEISTGLMYEAYRLILDGFYMSHSSFRGVAEGGFDGFDMIGGQLWINNMIAENISISVCAFAMDQVKIGSFVLSDSVVDGLTLSEGASFLGYAIDRTMMLNLAPGFLDDTNKVLLIETRPVIVKNCSFNNVVLKENSFLIVSYNPMTLLIDNNFTNITSESSTLLKIGKYIPLRTLPVGYTFGTSESMEDQIFGSFTTIKSFFREKRAKLSSYKSGGSTLVFAIIEGSLFGNVTSTNEIQIINILDIKVQTSMAGLFGNTIANISIESDNDFSLIKVSEVSEIVSVGSIFKNISGSGRAMSLSATALQNAQLLSNSFEAFSVTNGYQITSSVCGNIKFDSDSTKDITTEDTWMTVTCTSINGTFDFQNAFFSNIKIVSTVEKLLSLSFIQIQIQQKLPTSSADVVSFASNRFEDITLDMSIQPYALNVFISSVFRLELSNISFLSKENTFRRIWNVDSGRILSISANKVTFETAQFSDLTYSEPTGAVYIVTERLEVLNSTFIDNNGTKIPRISAVFINIANPSGNVVTVIVSNCTFDQNEATSASLISAQDFQLDMSIIDTNISDNFGNGSAAISLIALQNSNIRFVNTAFKFTTQSTPTSRADVLDVQDSKGNVSISFINCTVQTLETVSGHLISLSRNNNVSLAMTNVTYWTALGQNVSSFGILQADRVNASIDSLNVEGLHLDTGALFELICSSNGTDQFSASLEMTNSELTQLKLTNSTLFRLSANNIPSGNFCNTSISIISSNFSDISSSSDGPVIYSDSSQVIGNVSNSTLVNIDKCRFEALTALRGNIYFGKRLYYQSMILINNSIFTNIHATGEGGVIFIQNTTSQISTENSQSEVDTRRLTETGSPSSFSSSSGDLTEHLMIESCQFTNITAESGGIYYNNYSNPEGSITLSDNIFRQITANKWGAVIYTSDPIFASYDNSFFDTKVSISGTVIYSDRSTFNYSDFQKHNYYDSSVSQPMAFSPNKLDLQFKSTEPIVVSYDEDNTLIVRNLSTYSLRYLNIIATLQYEDQDLIQTVVPDGIASTKAEVNLTIAFSKSDTRRLPLDPCFTSSSNPSCLLDAKKFDILLTGNKSTIIEVNVTYQSKGLLQYSANRTFLIELRECIPGEINNTVTGECTPCEATTYSFNPLDKTCTRCPDGAICHGGAKIQVREGYWRRNSTSAQIIPCEGDYTRCIGGFDEYCREDRTGPVCLQCNFEDDYFAQNNGECSQCSDQGYLFGVGTVMLIVITVFQVFSLYTAFSSSKKAFLERTVSLSASSTKKPLSEGKEPVPGPYLEIFTTYSQMTSIFSEMVGGFLNRVFDVPATVGNPNQKIFFSLQCLLYLVTEDQLEILKYKTIIFVLSPLLKILIYLLVELTRGLIKRDFKKKELSVRIGAVTIGLISLEQPQIIGILCNYLACIRLDPTDDALYVAANPNVQCGTYEYNLFRYYFVLPSLMAWGFLVPLALILILAKKKTRLMESKSLFVVFGKLYDNYTPEAYFWGLVVILFKISMFVANSLLKPYNLGRGIVLIIIVHCYFTMYKRFNPHPHKDLARADFYTIRVFMWTILFVLLIDQLDTPWVHTVCAVFIVMANAIVICYLGLRIAAVYKKTIAPVIEKVKRRLSRGKTNASEAVKEDGVQGTFFEGLKPDETNKTLFGYNACI